MYSVISSWFSDWSDGIIFQCFSIWHWMYIALIVGLITVSICFLRNQSVSVKKKWTNLFIDLVFCLYIADFFLMPFALGEIDVDKLPFHSCTSMCVMCFWSNHNRVLGKLRVHFALLGVLSNLMYIAYPSGVMSYETHPFSYRAVQTLLFHSLMVVYGTLVLVFHGKELRLKKCYKDACILLGLTVWAFLGNTFYSGETEGYSRNFNWFFIRQDPFDLVPEQIAPYICPVINFVAFFTLEILIYLLCAAFQKGKDRKRGQEADAAESA